MTSGKPLDADQRTLVAPNRQDRYQKHSPLRKADAAAHAAIRQRLEKTDQVASSGGFSREGRQGCSAVPANVTVAGASDPGLLGQTSNRPWDTTHIDGTVFQARRVGDGYQHGRNSLLAPCRSSMSNKLLGPPADFVYIQTLSFIIGLRDAV